MHKLAIIILNYRTPGMVIECLQSLQNQVRPDHRVVVVDNCSGDDSADTIEAAIKEQGWDEWAQVERSPINGGFAAGNNVGIKSIDAEVYLLLNSDTIVREGAIETMLDTLETHPDVHMLGPQLEWMDGTHYRADVCIESRGLRQDVPVACCRERTPWMVERNRLGELRVHRDP